MELVHGGLEARKMCEYLTFQGFAAQDVTCLSMYGDCTAKSNSRRMIATLLSSKKSRSDNQAAQPKSDCMHT